MQILQPFVCGGLIVCLLSMAALSVHAQDQTSATGGATLRQAAGERLLMGTAVSPRQLEDPKLAKLIAGQFNSLTAENDMKPDALQRERGKFPFEPADQIGGFA